MNNDRNIFEYATRMKLRFTSARGELTTEQLWELPLRSRDGFDLDNIAKAVNKILKSEAEESFVRTDRRTEAQEKAEVALQVIKHIIAVKLAEEDSAKKRAANKVEKELLLKILAEKQAGELSALSAEEIKRRLDNLAT